MIASDVAALRLCEPPGALAARAAEAQDVGRPSSETTATKELRQ